MAGSTEHPGHTRPDMRLTGARPRFVGTAEDYLVLPGVLEAWPAHPGLGCVTLVVDRWAVNTIGPYLEPFMPLNVKLYVLSEEEARAITG